MMKTLLVICLLVSNLLAGCRATGTLFLSSYGGSSHTYRTTRATPINPPAVVNGRQVFGTPFSTAEDQTFILIDAGVSGVFVEQ